MSLLYQHGEALRRYHLAVGDGHQLAIEEYGNPAGVAVLVMHGGPGQGHSRQVLGYFNPQKYRIILFGQRGCGNSTPHSLEHIDTAHLLRDIDTLTQHIGISQFVLAGESWGATLALLYAQQSREKVLGLILWCSFLACDDDFEWLYGPYGAPAQFYPEHYHAFSQGIQGAKSILQGYQQALFSHDDLLTRKAAQQWCEWDNLIVSGSDTEHMRIGKADKQLGKAQQMVHFFTHQCFIADQQISRESAKLQGLPCWFIHSRHDLMCRYGPIYELAKTMEAQILLLNSVGHCSAHSAYSEAIRRAADLLLCKLNH